MTFPHCLLLLFAFCSLTSKQNYFLLIFFLCLQLRFPGYLIAVWRPTLKEAEYCSGLQWADVYANSSVTVVQSASLFCAMLFSLELAEGNCVRQVGCFALANNINHRTVGAEDSVSALYLFQGVSPR